MNSCPSCGWQNEPNGRFCVSCGARLAEASRPATHLAPSAPAPDSPPRSSPSNPRPGVHYGGAAARPSEPQGVAPPAPAEDAPSVSWEPEPVPAAGGLPGPNPIANPLAAVAQPSFEKKLEEESLRPSHRGASLEAYEREALARLRQDPEPKPKPKPEPRRAQAYDAGAAPLAPAPMQREAPAERHAKPGARLLVGFLASYEVLELGQFWPLYEGLNLVGRQGASDEADIEIAHATTSSRHAVITASTRPGRALLEDLGSTNGTFVNDVPLSSGHQWELADGDRIRLGLFTAVVKII